MKNKIKQYILKHEFNPGVGGIWLNPFYLARRGLFEEIRRFSGVMYGSILDVGCGSKPYEKLFTHSTQYIGLEIDSDSNRQKNIADLFYGGDKFPVLTSSFDGVVCNQVLEHIFNPDDFLNEIFRVLKPGGSLLLSIPFVWDEHEQPNDYARYSSFGIRYLLEKHGFTIVKFAKTNSDFGIIFQLINAYLYKILLTRSVSLNLIVTALVMSPFTVLGIFFGALFPKNPDLYLDQVIFARKNL